ncbi:MAG: siroheme synthase CysG [Pseudomonadota bacterium]
MRYFPTFVDVAGHAVVIVGDGEKALQKLRLLAKTEAQIKLVAPEAEQDLLAFAQASGVAIIRDGFAPAHLDGARLVIAAHDCVAVDIAVAEAAAARGIARNVVDRPHLSSFIVPAIVDRDPVVVAIGTEGAAPLIARDIKSKLDAMLPARLGSVARAAAGLRTAMGRAIRDPLLRRRAWEALLAGPWTSATLNGETAKAAAIFDEAIAASQRGEPEAGRVSLVGAGPGDPDLLTLRAQQRLQAADVLVVDGLVPEAVLEFARRDAERIHVGKTGYGRATPQSEINRVLVREALKGRHVVRLKAGDPFVFGRAAEEMRAVRAAGIDVDIVPGITAAHACAASIELPVTLRETVRQFSLVTGTTADGVPDLDWQALAKPGAAAAVYMGVRTAPQFRANLIAAGADRAVPVVIVENGTRPDECVVATTLGALPDAIAAHHIKGPAVVFIGLGWEMAHLSPPERVIQYAPVMPGRIDVPVTTAAPTGLPRLAEPKPADPRDPDDWTPQDIANATMWVAG